MKTNHIFIFCDNHEEVVNELLAFGFMEGSNRIHPNQGTQNRKFYFNDFFIEILWVHNFDEIQNERSKKSKLYERAEHKTNTCSAFGLCLNYSKEEDELFENCYKYKPSYIPSNMFIEVLKNEDSPSLPWTFRWQTSGTKLKINEPINFSKQKLSKIIFGIKKKTIENNYLELFNNDEVFFEDSKEEFVKLIFTKSDDKKGHFFESLNLIIEY